MLTTLLLWLALSPVAAVLIGRVLWVMGDGAGDMAGPCATLDQVTVKDGIVGKIVMMKSDPLRHQLSDSVGSQILIVVADPDEFTGERAPAKITPDQGDLEERVGVVHSLSDSAETANDKPFTH